MEMTKRVVQKYEVLDTNKLYDKLTVAIEYLHEIKNKYGPSASLGVEWYTYEDMDVVVYFNRLETDLEYKKRMSEEREKKKVAERKLLAERIAAEEKILEKEHQEKVWRLRSQLK